MHDDFARGSRPRDPSDRRSGEPDGGPRDRPRDGAARRLLEGPREIRVSCPPGLADILAEEIEDLDLGIVRRERSAVITAGSWPDTWRLCLELRTALAVLYPVHAFRCRHPDDLYRAAHGLAWEELLSPDERLTIESRVDHPTIRNSMFANVRLKDAICDRMRDALGRRPDAGPDRSGAVVFLHWKGNDATISLNAAGRKLADRGYRKRPHRAPLQETLAAAIAMTTGWQGTTPLLLPMCGSGTLAVEAALVALDRAPGLLRIRFGFEAIPGAFDAEAWKAMRENARRRALKRLDAPIVAGDIDPAAVEAAQANARTAGIEHLVEWHVGDFATMPIPDRPGTLIVNPEYGERLGDEPRLAEDYRRVGDFFKQRLPGWKCFLLSGNPRLTKHLRLKARRSVPFMNAKIECRLLQYEMWGPEDVPAGG